jgi:hypothetical protein
VVSILYFGGASVEEFKDPAKSVLRGSSWSMLRVASLVTFLWSTHLLISVPRFRPPCVISLDLGGREGGVIDVASMLFLASLPVVTAAVPVGVASVVVPSALAWAALKASHVGSCFSSVT